jgi:hypothetical protein
MACRTRCATQPANCPRPVFNNARKNITVSYNLCANQDVLAWAYRAENSYTNSYGFYHLLEDNAGVENLAVTQFLDPTTCMPCSCDSVLFFPELNLCSKVSIVLYTQKHGSSLANPQEVSSSAPGTTTCYVELSERATYQVWKAVLCSPVQCAQKVEFHLVAEVHTSAVPGEEDTEARFENVLLEHLLH